MTGELTRGSILGRYKIVSSLGEGGMGQVFRATDTTLGRDVALKVLPAQLASEPERLDRFVQEARIASALSHPNIAHLYEMSGSGAVPFIAMEYVEGETLSTRLARGPLEPREILNIGAQIADALDAAHSLGIIHRDIKSSNVLLTPRGQIKVLDFGLAKMKSPRPERNAETQLLTTAGMILGTVEYMSPEQALGREVDSRSDIFSLGAVLFELSSGCLPFRGATPQESIVRVLHDNPPELARLNPAIPPELERIIHKCLEKDRDRRYASARDLLVDLRNAERDLSSGAAHSTIARSAGPLRAVIVDDEQLARQILREYLGHMPEIEIAAECANGFEAVKAISEHRPDLVFLDVQMPKLDGFEVLELIGREVPVIFTTAYDSYAMRAFDAHAIDYLLKPFSRDRLETAVTRARQRLSVDLVPPTQLSAAARPPQQHLQRIVVKDGTRVHIIPVPQLEYAEAQDDYVALHWLSKSYLKQQTISSLEAALDPQQFVRIHRSYLVNLERVTRIEPYRKDSRVVILTGGVELPVSKAGYERLKALLDGRA